MDREVGGGIGMGNTCKPMAVSFQCMTKFTTNKKIILIKKAVISRPSALEQLEFGVSYPAHIVCAPMHVSHTL